MDETKENIKCKKGDDIKFFSRKQLDLIGEGPDGTFDGWSIVGKTPAGIPEPVDVGGITVVPVDPDATPDGVVGVGTIPADANVELSNPAPDEPADPAKTEKVNKPKPGK